jgi:transcriptional regulatory protein RtcR
MLLLDDADELDSGVQKMLLKTFEAPWPRPAADKKTSVDFELISTAGEDLRYDLSAAAAFFLQIGLWTFKLPSLKERPEDIPPNIEFLLNEYEKEYGQKCAFSGDALEQYLSFAQSPETEWKGNFRTLNQSVKRMYFLAKDKNIGAAIAGEEIERLLAYAEYSDADSDLYEYQEPVLASVDTDFAGKTIKPGISAKRSSASAGKVFSSDLENVLAECDEFDRVQLLAVIKTCRESQTLAAAGRRLYAQSRLKRVSQNDSDRLKKYLARFGLDWEKVRE